MKVNYAEYILLKSLKKQKNKKYEQIIFTFVLLCDSLAKTCELSQQNLCI